MVTPIAEMEKMRTREGVGGKHTPNRTCRSSSAGRHLDRALNLTGKGS